ncbi:unnamed protein product, partial [Scytosiphon promiscuus]
LRGRSGGRRGRGSGRRMRSSRSRTRGNKGVEPASDAAEVASVRGNKRPRQQQQSKQPQQQQQQQQQKKGGAKGKVDRHAALDEHMRREASDPYHICCPDLYPRCTRQDHARKKNCSNNPRCLYGLGEGKEGIWSAKPSLLSALGDDLSGVLKETALTPHADTADKTPPATAAAAATPAATGAGTTSTPTPGGDVVASPPPPRLPTGLKNLGATCYLNSQLQALFANKSFRDGVFSWKPSLPALTESHPFDLSLSSAGVGGASAVAVVDPTRNADGGGGGSGGSGASGVGSDGRDVSHGGASEGVVVGEAVAQAVSSENEDDKIMRELQVVFGHMQEGIAKVYDPSAFPALLRMDTGSQQDPQQEFSNFFRMLLERCFQRSPPPLRTLVQDTFCGEVAYITRCLTCKGGPRQQRTFNDLVLQINSHRSVEAILDGHLEREILDGSNQYNCESCGRKQDAMTMTELVRLPPVLSLQLVRYEYDYKTMEKKKIKAAVSLPPTLDMGPRIGPQGEGESGASVGGASVSPASGEKGRGEEFVYDLRCVLYHKGSNVHSGHIVAEVHDSATDTWTLFDDEKVRHIPGVNMSHPSHAAGGNGNGNSKKGKGKKQAKGKGNGNGKGKGKSKGEKEAEAKPSTSDDAAAPVAAAVEADADEETSREASETGHDHVGGSGSRKKVENGSSDNKRHLNDDDNGGESLAAKDSGSMAKKKNKTSRAVVVDAAEATGSATAAGSKGKRKGQEGTPAAGGRRERGKRSKVVEKDGGGDEDGLGENERGVEEAKDAAVTTATAGLEGDDASHSSYFPRGGRNGGEDAGGGGRAASRGVGEPTTTALPPPPKLPTSQMQSRWGRRGGQRSTVVEAAIAAAAAAAAAAGTTTTGTAEAVGSTSVPASTAKRAEIAAAEGGPLAWSPINGAEAAASSRQARLNARRGERAGATAATAAATIGSKSNPPGRSEEGPLSTDGAASPSGVAILIDDEDEDNDNDNDNNKSDNDGSCAEESGGEEKGGQQEEGNAEAGSSKAEAVVVGDKDSDGDGNSSSSGGGGGGGVNGKGGAERVRKPRGSEDAYMLIYVKRGVAWGPSSGERDRDKLPEDVLEAVQASNAVLTSEVARYRREKLQLEEDMRARRELYSALFGPPSKPPQRNRRKGTGKGKGPAKAIVIDGESGAGRQQDEEEEEE